MIQMFQQNSSTCIYAGQKLFKNNEVLPLEPVQEYFLAFQLKEASR